MLADIAYGAHLGRARGFRLHARVGLNFKQQYNKPAQAGFNAGTDARCGLATAALTPSPVSACGAHI